MEQQARIVLETAIADLREISQNLQSILSKADGPVRNELLKIKEESEAAIRYYSDILARAPRRRAPAIARQAAQAAFAGGVGLEPPQFSRPASSSEPRR